MSSEERHHNLSFPQFTVLKASAGSGKTYALARRFALFLLSDKVPKNGLTNLLAITFSNNAAKEMKERILNILKQICLGHGETLTEFTIDLSLPREVLRKKAGQLIDEILRDYGDFQVKTIDSFMTTIFKAASIDFGYSPDFEIVMNSAPVMEYAFSLFLRRVREGTAEGRFMTEVVDLIVANRSRDSSYLWEPSAAILAEIEEMYGKLTMSGKPVRMPDISSTEDDITKQIEEAIDALEAIFCGSRLTKSKSSSFDSLAAAVRTGRYRDLLERGMKNPPVCKPGKNEDHEAYHKTVAGWLDLERLIVSYTCIQAYTHFAPYLRVLEAFSDILERAKRHENKVFMQDVSKSLAGYVNGQIAPEIYFRLGEIIFHYLIDEFQDTSPVQWDSLFPLFENSLSQGGSLFVVGDTKQAIYGFRDADYKIMKGVERHNVFPSAYHEVKELDTNYRSDEEVVSFTDHLFHQTLPGHLEYIDAAKEAGLLDYHQRVGPGKCGKGYVETCLFERNDSEPPEREKLSVLVDGLLKRGYRYVDIAILTSKNDDVVKITTWLNARQIPFLSYSSLDVRRRRITSEIIALLQFLDSPIDDLSFATFLLGDIFRSVLDASGERVSGEELHALCFANRQHRGVPLYKAFQKRMGGLWERHFDDLFRSSGYSPLYDLVTDIYRVFDVFRLFGEQEEGVLARILEVVKDLEAHGGSSLRSFLQSASSSDTGEGEWNIDVPQGMNAVKVMTIHKAKGLGFPVVILVLYGERNKGFKYIIREADDSVALLRLTRRTASLDSEFEALYTEEERKEKVNRLNSLYVAFTRAGSELYVVGVKREKETFPFTLFPNGMVYSKGEMRDVLSRAEKEQLLEEGYHPVSRVSAFASFEVPLNFEEKRRGDLVHRVFSMIPYVTSDFETDLERIIRNACDEMRIESASAEIKDRIGDLLHAGELAPYYDARVDRVVMVERELVDREGRLFRVDRIVIDPEVVTIIEYKTGKDRGYGGDHVAQMHNYLRIVSDLFPDRLVEGIIGYVDLTTTVKVPQRAIEDNG
jgi:ATP-dependent helicase/nuclease subunit A